MLIEILEAGILSAVLTIILYLIIRKIGTRGKFKNLYTSVRGGTPRAVGLAPFLVLIIFLNPDYSYIVAAMGIMALLDDLIGRKNLKIIPVELGHIFRGLGILLVVILGYPLLGPSSILVALMIQPLNIADMQPGSACNTILSMSGLIILLYLLSGNFNTSLYFIPLIILAVCAGYAPLDYKGNIMMGEVGNHSFAVALGIIFFLFGGFWGLIILFLGTVFLIAFIRRKNLQIFLETKLRIENPTFGDYFMDVLTGGGLGDLFRKIILKKREFPVKNGILIRLGFRRLLYNPFL
jgi:hypothetical protein